PGVCSRALRRTRHASLSVRHRVERGRARFASVVLVGGERAAHHGRERAAFMTRRSARTTALAYRSTSIAALAVVASGTSGGEARAAGLATSDESALSATMQCDPALGGGRVKCVVEARAEKAAIAWADVAL